MRASSESESNPNASNASRLETTLKTRFITQIDELCRLLELPEPSTSQIEAAREFPLLAPESILDRISKGNPNDPVLLQFMPNEEETKDVQGFVDDPLCEFSSPNAETSTVVLPSSKRKSACILQKYAGRVLVLTTNACSARCRYCFRRGKRAPSLVSLVSRQGEDVADAGPALDAIFESVRTDPSVREVIFSGGDPLALSDDSLRALFNSIRKLENVNRVRFHSRVPILVPKRIDENFPSAEFLGEEDPKRQIVAHISVHVNVPNEINDDVVRALLRLRRLGFVLTSQTVLLKGVNDDVDVLAELFTKLSNVGVIPYYLHQLDRVRGAARFEVPVAKGLELMKGLSERLPGYAVPRYAREIPGRLSKVDLLAEPNADFHL